MLVSSEFDMGMWLNCSDDWISVFYLTVFYPFIFREVELTYAQGNEKVNETQKEHIFRH